MYTFSSGGLFHEGELLREGLADEGELLREGLADEGELLREGLADEGCKQRGSFGRGFNNVSSNYIVGITK